MKVPDRSRRTLLRCVATASTLSLSGCSSFSQSSEPTRTSEDDQTTTSPSITRRQTTERRDPQETDTPEETETAREFTQSLTSFIQRDGRHFTLEGGPYYFHGTNNDLLFRAPDWYVDRVYQAANTLGLDVVRMTTVTVGENGPYCQFEEHCDQGLYSFATAPDDYNEAAFRGMDYAIAKANEAGIRLVIPFILNDVERGMGVMVDWSPTAEVHDDFYTDEHCRQYYKDYVKTFLTRTNTYTGIEYRNDPAVMMWELANEPLAHGFVEGEEDYSNERDETAADKLTEWISEMAPFISDLAPNQLVATGSHGYYPTKREYRSGHHLGGSYIENNQIDGIDACSVHMYPHSDEKGGSCKPERDECSTLLEEHIKDAHETIGKPFYLGEFRPAIPVDRRDSDWQQQDKRRSERYAKWYAVLDKMDADGAIQWPFFMPATADSGMVSNPGEYDSYNSSYSVYPDDTYTAQVMKEYSETVERKSES